MLTNILLILLFTVSIIDSFRANRLESKVKKMRREYIGRFDEWKLLYNFEHSVNHYWNKFGPVTIVKDSSLNMYTLTYSDAEGEKTRSFSQMKTAMEFLIERYNYISGFDIQYHSPAR